MDFVTDQLSNGRRFKVLNVVNDYSREIVAQLVSVFISGRQVARFLSQLIEQCRKSAKVIFDNETEFTSRAMFFWSKDTGVELGFLSSLAIRHRMRSWKALMASSETNV